MRGLITAKSAPIIFVLLWSTGFTGIKYGIPYAPPFTFIAIRMAIAGALLAVIALAITKKFIFDLQVIGKSALIGLAIHGAYLGGCFYGVKQGMPAGITALICSLQPVLVSIASARFFGEKLSSRKITGLSLGLVGLILVITPRLEETSPDSLPIDGLVAVCIALLGGTIGTLLQKKYGGKIEVLAGTSWQYLATFFLMITLAFLFEDGESIAWNFSFVASLLWLTIALSLGAILVLYYLLARSSAAAVSSLYYLVPAVTAIEAYFLFGETISVITAIGSAITILGVAIVLTGGKAPSNTREG
jgi:drug/metabolite transporter (DMT)-like permease